MFKGPYRNPNLNTQSLLKSRHRTAVDACCATLCVCSTTSTIRLSDCSLCAYLAYRVTATCRSCSSL
jgi:hypothetical protein